jgi:hypothetical protein
LGKLQRFHNRRDAAFLLLPQIALTPADRKELLSPDAVEFIRPCSLFGPACEAMVHTLQRPDSLGSPRFIGDSAAAVEAFIQFLSSKAFLN